MLGVCQPGWAPHAAGYADFAFWAAWAEWRHTGVVTVAQRAVVNALEATCRATRFVEWVPGWRLVYPQCLFARWSNALDKRWGTEVWPQHDWEEWQTWWDGLERDDHDRGHWHAW